MDISNVLIAHTVGKIKLIVELTRTPINCECIENSHSMMKQKTPPFSEAELSRIIEMAWEDRTPFDAIEASHGISERQVIGLMRSHLKAGSFRSWRKRVTSRSTKHVAKRPVGVARAYCPTQYKQR